MFAAGNPAVNQVKRIEAQAIRDPMADKQCVKGNVEMPWQQNPERKSKMVSALHWLRKLTAVFSGF